MDTPTADIDERLHKLSMGLATPTLSELPSDNDTEAYRAVLRDLERLRTSTTITSTNGNSLLSPFEECPYRSNPEEYLRDIEAIKRSLDNVKVPLDIGQMQLEHSATMANLIRATTAALNGDDNSFFFFNDNNNTITITNTDTNTDIDNPLPQALLKALEPISLYRSHRQRHNNILYGLGVLRCRDPEIGNLRLTPSTSYIYDSSASSIFIDHPLRISDIEASFQMGVSTPIGTPIGASTSAQPTGTGTGSKKLAQFKAALEGMLNMTRQHAARGVEEAREDVGPLEEVLGKWSGMIGEYLGSSFTDKYEMEERWQPVFRR